MVNALAQFNTRLTVGMEIQLKPCQPLFRAGDDRSGLP
jgi:hypothetical protein